LPGHQAGPSLEGFEILERAAQWLGLYIKMMKQKTPSLPIFVLSRSSSSVLVGAVNKLYPELDGVVFMSPTLPGDQKLVQEGSAEVKQLAREGVFTLNEEGLNWIDRLLMQATWSKEYFGTLKLMISTGSKDRQIVKQERDAYRSFAEGVDSITYFEFEGADHNVLNTDGAYRSVFDFIYRILFSKKAQNIK